MLGLFDQPVAAFYDAYGLLEPGHDERTAIYRLWPALVHMRLFGAGYRAMVERLLYDFRLIDSMLKGDSRGLAKQIGLSAMSRGIGTHGKGLRAFERGGAGEALYGMPRRDCIAAFPGDLAFGAWSHHLASGGNDGVWGAMD